MKKLAIFTVMVAIITLVGFWGGQKVCMMMWPTVLRPNDNWYFTMGLDEKETAALKTFQSTFQNKTDRLCMHICKERLELLKLMGNKSMHPETIYQKIEEIGAKQTALEKETATHILEIKSRLTHTQSKRLLAQIRKELEDAIIRSGYAKIL